MNDRFEIDPTLVADAVREGRKLSCHVWQDNEGRVYKKVTLGPVSPYVQPLAKRAA